jgi:hypothetical protein
MWATKSLLLSDVFWIAALFPQRGGRLAPIIRAMKRFVRLALVIAALVLSLFAKDFVMPRLVPASTMTAHDAHPNEKVTVGIEAYDTQAKASIFRAKLLEHSVLPVRVVFTNDGDQPVVLNNVHFELVTRDRAKAEPFSIGDLQRALTNLRAPDSRGQDKLPIPMPGKGRAHGGVPPKEREELEQSMFAARAVEPHGSQQGFLFFDTGDLENPAQGARLFVTGVNDARGHELMYFEVELK